MNSVSAHTHSVSSPFINVHGESFFPFCKFGLHRRSLFDDDVAASTMTVFQVIFCEPRLFIYVFSCYSIAHCSMVFIIMRKTATGMALAVYACKSTGENAALVEHFLRTDCVFGMELLGYSFLRILTFLIFYNILVFVYFISCRARMWKLLCLEIKRSAHTTEKALAVR